MKEKEKKKKKKTDFKSILETYSVYAILEGTLEMEWLGACLLNVKNSVKREGQYNKFFSYKESKWLSENVKKNGLKALKR